MRWLDRIDRAQLVTKGVALGFDRAQLNLWLDRVLQARDGLRAEQVAAIVAQLDAQISALTTQRNRAQAGHQFVVDNAPAGNATQVAVKTATLTSIDDGIARTNQLIAQLTAQRAALA